MSLEVRDGEATLLDVIYADSSLEDVLDYAKRNDFKIRDLKVERVTTNSPWRFTEESTVVVPVIYLDKNDRRDIYLITKRSPVEDYALFRYRWTP